MIRHIDAETLCTALDMSVLVDDLEVAHREDPPAIDRSLLTSDRGGFLVLPSWSAKRGLGAKLVTAFPENPAKGLPTVQGLYMLFDAETGAPRALIDGAALTFAKTAADSALGSKLLSRSEPTVLLMVGAGALAPWLIRAHRAVRPSIERVLVWNRTRARAEYLAEMVGGSAVTDLHRALASAEIVCAATGATEPLIEGRFLRAGTHVDLVGSYRPDMRESDDDCVRMASLYVDARWSTIAESGDLTAPIAKGLISEDDILGDLFDLAQGRAAGRRDDEEITLFKNGGGAHLDLFVASILLDRLGE